MIAASLTIMGTSVRDLPGLRLHALPPSPRSPERHSSPLSRVRTPARRPNGSPRALPPAHRSACALRAGCASLARSLLPGNEGRDVRRGGCGPSSARGDARTEVHRTRIISDDRPLLPFQVCFRPATPRTQGVLRAAKFYASRAHATSTSQGRSSPRPLRRSARADAASFAGLSLGGSPHCFSSRAWTRFAPRRIPKHLHRRHRRQRRRSAPCPLHSTRPEDLDRGSRWSGDRGRAKHRS
jgi:hypothetical protein